MSAVQERTLELREAIEGAVGSPLLLEAVQRHGGRSDGLVPLVIIRPGIGRGKGNHYYPGQMLQEAVQQGRFRGWKMYVDHQDAEAKKRSAGLPRSMKDLGGVLKEAWWDPNYSTPDDAARGHERGAVLGLAKPTRFMRSLIEDIPEAVGASISAAATTVRPHLIGGKQHWLVEGIQPRGSVDWVTEAGAGGRVLATMEALQESWSNELEEAELMGLMNDDELREWLQRERPDLLLSLSEADDHDADDFEKCVQKHMPRVGGDRKKAEHAARKEMGMNEGTHDDEGEEDMTPQAIAEALNTEEGRAAVAPIVEALFLKIVGPKLGELIEATLEDERELMQAEADAASNRRLQVRDLRDLAHSLIRESRLLEAFQAPLLKKYDIVDGTPTTPLDVIDVREGMTVTKTAEEVLRESVATDINEQRELLASARPTRVTGQGGTKPVELGGDGKPVEESKKKTSGSPLTDAVLQESSFSEDDLADMWDGV